MYQILRGISDHYKSDLILSTLSSSAKNLTEFQTIWKSNVMYNALLKCPMSMDLVAKKVHNVDKFGGEKKVHNVYEFQST